MSLRAFQLACILVVVLPVASPFGQAAPLADAPAPPTPVALSAPAEPVLTAPSRSAAAFAPAPPPARADASGWILRDRLVVGLDADPLLAAPLLAQAAEAAGGRVLRVDTALRFAVVASPPAEQEALAKRLAAVPGVAYAKPDTRAEASYVPNDPLYGAQWGAPAIGMPAAWNATRGGHDRMVAVLDTGVNVTHPDLAANVCVVGPDYPEGDADPDDHFGHGTHVAGTIAAAINSSVGVAGMADACLMAVKVLGDGGSGSFADVASGIVWAVDHGANVVSMSLGGCPGCDPGSPVTEAVAYAAAQDVLVVAAAGNAYCAPVSYPAGYPEVVAVAALAPPGNERASFSSCGDKVEVAAPGAGVVSTVPTSGYLADPSGYMNLSGTSMATPHVSGVAALLWHHNLSLTSADVRCILAQTADDLLDAAEAIANARCVPTLPSAPALGGYGADGKALLSWTRSASWGSNVTEYRVYRGADPGNLTLVATANATALTDPGLVNGVTYHYQVAGVNALGEGNRSAVFAVTPMAPRTLPYADDVENGTGGWTATGLWHVATDRSHSPNHSWYFGTENGPGLDDNTYATGMPVSGALVSPAINLTNATFASLRFWHRWEGEGYGWEHPILQASPSPEGPWATVLERHASSGEALVAANLSAYVGGVVHVRFFWDTIDDYLNDFEGWYVDDVEILDEPTPLQCAVENDTFGNVCSEVPYAFEDVSATGTPIPLGDDEVSGPIALPFPFAFYGVERTEVQVASNGFLTFGANQSAGCCSGRPIPHASLPDDLIVGFWADLFPNATSVRHATLGEEGARRFIVQYTSVPTCCAGENVTFQVKLFEGTDVIEVHYLDAATGDPYASAGIEDCNGEDGILMDQGYLSLTGVAVRYAPGAGAPPACNRAPTVEISSPAEGETLQGLVQVTGNASDPDANDSIIVTVCLGYYCVGAGANVSSEWAVWIDTRYASNGTQALTAHASDGKLLASDSVTVVVANARAQAFIQSPTNGSAVSGAILVTGNASNPNPNGTVQAVYLRIDGTYRVVNGTTNWSFALDTTTLADGWHQLAASAYDGAVWGPEHVIYVQVSNVANGAPVALVTFPANGTAVNGTIVVRGNASDPDANDSVVSVRLRVDNATFVANGTTNWSFALDTRGLANGWHVLAASASDGDAWGPEHVVLVRVDNPPPAPTVAITAPSPGQVVGGTVRVEGVAGPGSEERPVVLVQVRVDGGAWTDAAGLSTWVAYWNATNASEGWHAIEARSFDGVRFSSVARVDVEVRHEDRPTVRIAFPWNGATVSGVLLVRGDATDDDGVESVEVRVDGGEWRPANGTASWQRLVDTRLLADGVHDLEARAFDGERHSRVALAQVLVANGGAPAIQIDAPLDGSTVGGAFA
ncbi:MAG TPA: S8 family serine peptidase, partial [Candidatus Thermoplasmatota archaeon]|nr:S8 family serine peptidase [Candidatus Thermoplasmatota archaeon]